MFNKTTTFVLFTIYILNLTIAFSDEVSIPAKKSEEAIREEIRWLQAESIITIATRHETSIDKAPSVATVITARQIKQMGFRTLADILKIVPGYDVSMDENGTRNIAVRGGTFRNSERVRVLIDGHPVNDPYWGGAMNNFYDMIVENIKRIEVVRGPGSALFGKNAFFGVINIVTKDTEDIDGFQWTGSGGSFDTQNYNMLFAKEYDDIKISGFFDWIDTEGFSRKVEQDNFSPPSLSMSPGRSQNEREKTDLNLKLSYKNLEIKAKYMKRRREGYIGISGSLTDESDLKDTYWFAELIYKNLSLTDKLNMTPKVYYDRYDFDYFHESRPQGFQAATPVPGFFIPYPNGISGLTALTLNTLGFEDQFDYDLFDGNRLTFGFQYEWLHQHNARSAAFNVDVTNNFFPISPVRDFSRNAPFIRDKATRQIWSLYAQDEWNITDNIDLTVGVRYDHFTRFEGTTNPRVGLVWRFMDDAYMKLLFATAFRAPNFREMFLQNNPLILGNSNLDPEKINTYEFQVGYNFTKHISGSMNFFFNRTRDLIVLVPEPGTGAALKYQNSSGTRIMGSEVEVRAGFGGDNYAYANYTYQDAEDTRDRDRVLLIPQHKANFGVNIGVTKYVNANLHSFVSGRRPREISSTRKDMPSYALVNCALIGKNFMDNFEVRGSVQNLFDKDYDDPSGSVPSNHPQQGRSFMVELRFEF
ncbi:TonB-dependent receptor [Candidatus Scalindua japonica]|uniref:TonB-dependent receptor n=1 Tax=Candidatus Scalindua japonica TaxID=1284222 RepID=A0A286U252_9BACT|nr:TonB-dependent receptor [Candidatus Scalindua japonica]GAX62214.1 TonB-dependent receptor [Candidatus Scalindua japonica]